MLEKIKELAVKQLEELEEIQAVEGLDMSTMIAEIKIDIAVIGGLYS
jgi:hypothetical protein